ncbi:MAG: AAA family ATPase [Desulfocapsaceae bacterium]|nr:AAA family ATPase [Desulfocapsaceae bacterium]
MQIPSTPEIIEQISESSRFFIFRGRDRRGQGTVILKVLKGDPPSPGQMAGLQREYEIIRAFSSDRIIRAFGLQPYGNSLAMVLEDFQGVPLAGLRDAFPSSLEKYLQIAVQLTEALDDIHRKGITHQNLNPAGILYNPDSGQLKIFDFCMASRGAAPLPSRSFFPEKSLLYAAPELLGRIHAMSDRRSDLYSLGIIIYELLTGIPPFQSDNSSEMIRLHLSQPPRPPHTIHPDIPLVLSRMVLKLLEKSPADRYQSCRGLRNDLFRCLHDIKTVGGVLDFVLGLQEVSGTFRIAKGIGHIREQEVLRSACADAGFGARRAVIVRGVSGIGKTSLVQAMRKTVAGQGGYFLSGKSVQGEGGFPYMPLLRAFRGLVRLILAEDDVAIHHWKRELLAAIHPNGRIILDLVPEMEGILGAQPPVPGLEPAQTAHRFRLVLCNFIRACTACRSPFVLFLDDVQWADPDSLRLIGDLLTDPSVHGLLLICSESGETSPEPLQAMKTRLHDAGPGIHSIDLAPLTLEDVTGLLAETLFSTHQRVAELALVCQEKSRGIPLVLEEFLLAAYRAGYVFFDIVRESWRWNMEAIAGQNAPADLAGMFAARMKTLPKPSLGLLKLAACLGEVIDLAALSCDQSASALPEDLQILLDEGLLVRQDYPSPSPSFRSGPAGRLFPSSSVAYEFGHDLIRQAASSLISEEEMAGIHRAIAQRLAGDEQFLDRVHHLNAGMVDTADPKAKVDLARKNLMAGRQALALAAFHQAAVFFETGLGLLPAGSWKNHYDLALALHLETIRAGCRSPEGTDLLVNSVWNNGATALDKARACQQMLRYLKERNQPAEALRTGLTVLASLGVSFPARPGKIHIHLARRKMHLLLANARIDDLLHLPAMTDPTRKIIMELLSDVGLIARILAPELFPLIVRQAIVLSLRHGNALQSAGLGYAPYGVFQCGMPGGNVRRGHAFGMLALDLQKQREGRVSPETLYNVNRLIIPWQEHISVTLPALRTAYRYGLEEGDVEFAADALLACSSHRYWIGGPLPETREELEKNGEAIQRLGRKIPLDRHRLYQQAVENLLGRNERPARFIGTFYDESSMLPLHAEAGDKGTLFLAHLLKMAHAYLFLDLEQARESLAAAREYLSPIEASILIPLFNFYSSLIDLALYDKASAAGKKAIWKRVSASQRKMRKWADYAPMNYLHKYWLVEAERERILGREALECFDRAIRQARESGFLQEEGLAYELASRYHDGRGREHLARVYIREARCRYERWGAWAKVGQLDAMASGVSDAGAAQPAAEPVLMIDAKVVVDASRRLMDEIMLEDLLLKMTGIMVESAGAQQGLLFLREKEGWCVRAKGTMSGRQVVKSHMLASPRDTPLSVIEAVARTGTTVVLDDPGEAGPFAGDAYLFRAKPKSILCTPIVHQDDILCIVYMENNLTASAFPPACQELIRLLCSLAALSLRNSNLYERLSRTVERLHEERDKRQEAQLQLLHAEKLSALGRLSASIAHEFGNPLIGVRYLIEDIQRRPALSREDRDLLAIGLEECDRMKLLINDLQQLNRPSSGKHTRFNIHRTIDNVLLFQKKNLKYRKIAIVKAYDLSLPEIVAVEDQITQVLVNLTINAVDAMPAEGGCITVSTSGNGESVFIAVKDTGEGIRSEDLEHIFEPFFSTKPTAEGTGLGLPVSYGIIAGHGGTITCSSKPGQGSTFTISLPVTPADMPSEVNR